jgi:hypothetical protein
MARQPRPALDLPAPRTARIARFRLPRAPNSWRSFGQAFNQHVGRRLNVLRLYNGKNQTEMGELCGLPFQQIAKYEHGRAKVPPDKLWLIAHYFSIDINYFFDEFDPADLTPKPLVTPDAGHRGLGLSRLKIAAALAKITSVRKLHTLIGLVQAMADEPDGK